MLPHRLVKDVLVVRGCIDISRIEADALVPHIIWLKLGSAGKPVCIHLPPPQRVNRCVNDS